MKGPAALWLITSVLYTWGGSREKPGLKSRVAEDPECLSGRLTPAKALKDKVDMYIAEDAGRMLKI